MDTASTLGFKTIVDQHYPHLVEAYVLLQVLKKQDFLKEFLLNTFWNRSKLLKVQITYVQ